VSHTIGTLPWKSKAGYGSVTDEQGRLAPIRSSCSADDDVTIQPVIDEPVIDDIQPVIDEPVIDDDEEELVIDVEMMSMSGCPFLDKKGISPEVASGPLAVRCCDSTDYGRVDNGGGKAYGCQKVDTYQKAEQICSNKNLQVCTMDQLGPRKKGCNTGCGFDHEPVWTSTPAQDYMEQ